MMKYLPLLVLFFIGQLALAQSPFCAPTYSGTPGETLCINSVELGSYTSNSTSSVGNPDAGYTDHSGGNLVSVCGGSTYKIKVNVSRTIAYLNNPGASAYVMAFFDWNNDGEINGPNEAFHLGEVLTSTSPVSFNLPGASTGLPETDVESIIDVPFDVASGFHFRVAILLENVQTTCEELFVGEMEDFEATGITYGETDLKNQFITTFDPVAVNLTLDVPADPIDWQVDNGAGFVDFASFSGLATVSYTPMPGINSLRAYKTEPLCITDTASQTRVFSSRVNLVKLGADDIDVSSSSVCQDDSVSTFHSYSNKVAEFENNLPTQVTVNTSPDTSTLEVAMDDAILDFSTLNKVCFNITSNAFSDLSIVLQSPQGKKVILSKLNGTGYNPATSTADFCFTDSIGADFINGFTSNLNGPYNPAQSLSNFSGDNPNGTWNVFFSAIFQDAAHTVNSWSMEFGHQTFLGWNAPDRYADATLDSGRVQVVGNETFRAVFLSEHGNNDLDSVAVSVAPSEDVKLDQLTMDESNICPNTTSVFRSTLQTGHNDVYYEWFLNGVLQNGENEDTVEIANLNDGDIVKVIADVQTLCNTSKDSLSITISGQTFKDAELSLSQNKEFPLCENEDLIVSVEIKDGDANFSSEWLVNNVSMSQNTASYNWMSVNDNDSLIYNYTQTNACGGVQTFSDTIVYEGTAREDINATFNVNNGVTFCESQSISFFVTVNDPNISADYTWLLDGVDLMNNKNDYESSDLAVGNHTIDVVYEPNGGCFNQQNTVATVSFSIDPIRETQLEINGETLFCSGTELEFNISDSANIGAGALYKWYENGVEMPNETQPILSIVNPVEGNTYKLEAVSEVNCASPALVFSNELLLEETKLSALEADLAEAFLEEYCQGTQLLNNAVFSGDATLISAQWNLNGSQIQVGEALDYILANGTQALDFVYEYDRGCDVIESGILSNTFEVFSPADTDFSVAQNSTEYTVSLTNAFDESNTSYEWMLNAEFLSNVAEPVFELSDEGIYSICVSTSRGNSEICPSDECIEFEYIGIDDVEFSNSIQLFPNPANDEVYVQANFSGTAEYIVINNQGKKVLEGVLSAGKQKIDLHQIQMGAYQVIIVANNKTGVKRFMKM